MIRHGRDVVRAMTPLLNDKNAIIYGAGGGIGGGVARTFAREGARVFLVGRTHERLERVAGDIAASDGSAEIAVLDALDEHAVDQHVRAVADQAGQVDVSFNLVSRGDVQGIPLLDMSPADFAQPVSTGLATNFLTARAAARQMITPGSGVILSLTSGSSRGTHAITPRCTNAVAALPSTGMAGGAANSPRVCKTSEGATHERLR